MSANRSEAWLGRIASTERPFLNFLSTFLCFLSGGGIAGEPEVKSSLSGHAAKNGR